MVSGSSWCLRRHGMQTAVGRCASSVDRVRGRQASARLPKVSDRTAAVWARRGTEHSAAVRDADSAVRVGWRGRYDSQDSFPAGVWDAGSRGARRETDVRRAPTGGPARQTGNHGTTWRSGRTHDIGGSSPRRRRRAGADSPEPCPAAVSPDPSRCGTTRRRRRAVGAGSREARRQMLVAPTSRHSV